MDSNFGFLTRLAVVEACHGALQSSRDRARFKPTGLETQRYANFLRCAQTRARPRR